VCRRVVVENVVRGHGDQNCACRVRRIAAALYGERRLGDEFTGIAADNAGPKYAVRLPIEQQLREPLLASEAERPQGQAPSLTGVPLARGSVSLTPDPTDFTIAVGDEGDDACVKGTLGPAGHLGDDLAGALDERHLKIQVCGAIVRPGPTPQRARRC